ncbi:porin family protein [Alkalicaulis satelles]|nr:porin family protein [Alkalicaulis satelles]
MAVLSGGAYAQISQAYVGLGGSRVDADDVNLNAFNVRLGADLNEFFAIEGEGLIGVGDDTAGGVKVKLNYGVAGFVRARAPLGDGFSVHARAGFGWLEAEATAGGMTMSEDESGFGYGAGAEWMFAGPNGLRFDYTRYNMFDDINVWTVSYVRRF